MSTTHLIWSAMAAAATCAPAVTAHERITAGGRRLHAPHLAAQDLQALSTFLTIINGRASLVPKMVPAAAIIPTPSACIHLWCCKPVDLLKRPCLVDPTPSCTPISFKSMTCFCFPVCIALWCNLTSLKSLSLTASVQDCRIAFLLLLSDEHVCAAASARSSTAATGQPAKPGQRHSSACMASLPGTEPLSKSGAAGHSLPEQETHQR